MKRCSNCIYYDQCKTVKKPCVYYTPKYCKGQDCNECKMKLKCDKN